MYFDENGIAALEKDGIWTYFKEDGTKLASFALAGKTKPYPMSDGCLAVCEDGKWGYIDINGKTIVTPQFEAALPVRHGKAWVKTAEGWGVIQLANHNSQQVTPFQDFEKLREAYELDTLQQITSVNEFYMTPCKCYEGYNYKTRIDGSQYTSGYRFYIVGDRVFMHYISS